MPVPALGTNGDVCTVPVLWDGQTDNKDSVSVSLDVQGGDWVEVTLSMASAGSFQWTCACRSGTATFLMPSQGFYTGNNPADLTVLDDRSWSTLLQAGDAGRLTIGVDHAANTATQAGSNTSIRPGYRISNVVLSACVIGKNY
jgi:hypothetical protein